MERENERTESEEFDLALAEVLPNDLDVSRVESTAAAQGPRQGPEAWFAANYTDSQQVDHDRQDQIAASQIEAVASKLGLSSTTIGMAKSTFAQYRDRAETRFIVEFVATAAVYCACKINNEALSPDEVAEAGPDLFDRKMLLRRSKEMASTLGLDVTAFTDASQYVDRYCDELEVTDPVRDRAHQIVDLCEVAGLSSGKSPTGWAAAALYLSSRELNEGLRQHDLTRVADVSEMTIRNRYQEQQEFLERNRDTLEGPPNDCLVAIDWLVQHAELGSELLRTGVALWNRIQRSSLEVDPLTGAPKTTEFSSDPGEWAAAMILFAAEVRKEDVDVERLASLSKANSDDLADRAAHLKQLLKDRGVDRYEELTK